jgi:hypothetical protein
MNNNLWNTHTTKIFIATYSAAFVFIAATALLKINLMKILLVYTSILFNLFVFIKSIISFLTSGRLPPPGSNTVFEFFEKMGDTVSYLNFNELVVFGMFPIICIIIEQIYIKEQTKQSQS